MESTVGGRKKSSKGSPMNLVLVVLVVLDAEVQSMGKVDFLDTRRQSGEAVREEEQLVKDRGWRDKRAVESMEITIARFAVRRNNLGVEVKLDGCDLCQHLLLTRALQGRPAHKEVPNTFQF